MVKGKLIIIILLIILLFNIVSIYYCTYTFGSNKIQIQDQGCSCPWKTEFGGKKIKQMLLEKNFVLDSIETEWFYTSGLRIDSAGDYFPYDDFLITFELDTLGISVNTSKKYCPVLKVSKWEHVNTYFTLGNVFSLLIIGIIIIVFTFRWIFSKILS